MTATVAIVAGRGTLPGRLARALEDDGARVVVAALEGVTLDLAPGREVIRFRLERLGALFDALRQAGVARVIFAGGIDRPRINPARLDYRTAALLPRLLSALRGGDDHALRVVVEVFEREGFAVVGAHEILPDLLAAPGVITRATPNAADKTDAARAACVVAALSDLDVGQGAVVAQGMVLAIETAPGTDRMLDWVAETAGAWRPDPQGARGVLFKGPKRGQERRMDLPTIGPDTVTGAAGAGLAGIVVEAGGVIVLDRPAVVAACDASGLFLWARPPEWEDG